MLHFLRRGTQRLLFEPDGADTEPRRLAVLDFHVSQAGTDRQPAQGTIRVLLESEEARRWSLRLGGRWRVHHRSWPRRLHLNGPLASMTVNGSEVQTWRWEDATA